MTLARQTVFVGSTFDDMQAYRKEATDALVQMDAIVRGMEFFGARPNRPVDECLSIVRQSDIYVGIFGMRYGSIPRGFQESMTHLEYLEAQSHGVPSLIYIWNEHSQPALPIYVDRGKSAERLRRLKEELTARHICHFFTTPDDFGKRFRSDLVQISTPTGRLRRGALIRPSRRSRLVTVPDPTPVAAMKHDQLHVVSFTADLEAFALAAAPHAWGGLDSTSRRTATSLGTKLEPIAQIVPEHPVSLVIGFECLAIGPYGESFGELCRSLRTIDRGLVRLLMTLSAFKTANALRASAERGGYPGAKHLLFTVNLDPEMLESPFLEDLLDRYHSHWSQANVIFEINERLSQRYLQRIKTLQADFRLRFCADDINRWHPAVKKALQANIEMSKVDCSAFLQAMTIRGNDAAAAIDLVASHRLLGKPLVVEGVEDPNYSRFLRGHWREDLGGTLYGQGHCVVPGFPWDAWTADLRDYGFAGGHVLKSTRDRPKSRVTDVAV